MTLNDDIAHHVRVHGARRQLYCLFFIAVSLAYLSWRLTTFNPYAIWLSTLFYMAEAFGFILTVNAIVMSWRYRRRHAIPLPASTTRPLSVDVFILSYKEPVELLRRTVGAALKINYPHQTWLLDDGNRAEMRALAGELGCHYLSRQKNIGAKAGNINNGLKHSSGEFVAVFDADHVPMPEALDHLLGFFDDAEVAMVQSPQDYYNTNSFQYLKSRRTGRSWHDQSNFYFVNQPCRDQWNATTGCGTSLVYRRSHLDEIGGIPTATVTEDMHTTVRLHKAGKKVAFYNEPIAYGIAAPDIGEFYRTRLRWGQGNLHVLRAENVLFTRRLTFLQRLSYLALGIIYLEGWQTLLLALVPTLTLITGLAPFEITNGNVAVTLAYTAIALWAGGKISYGYDRLWVSEFYAMARFPVYLLSWIGLVHNRTVFRVSYKNLGERLPLRQLSPQLFVALLGFIALGMGLFQYFGGFAECTGPAGVRGAGGPLLAAFGGGCANYTADVLIIAGAWALYNALRALLVVKKSVDVLKARRESYRHPVTLPFKIDVQGVEQVCQTINMGAGGLAFQLPAEACKLDLKGLYAITLYLPSGPLKLSLKVTGVNGSIYDASYEDVSVDETARICGALQSCDWQFELANADKPFTGKCAITWRAALFEYAKNEQGAGFVGFNAQGIPQTLMSFRPLELAAQLKVHGGAPFKKGLWPQQLQVGPAEILHRALHQGSDGARFYRYLAASMAVAAQALRPLEAESSSAAAVRAAE